MPTRPAVTQPSSRFSSRKSDLAAIHIGKAALGWSDDEYRDILFTVCQVRSSAELDHAGRRRFLDHLRACGFKGNASAREKTKTKTAKAWTPELRKIWSLWQQLADEGAVHDRGKPALVAWVKRLAGVDQLEWLNGHQTALVIEALKKWLARVEDEKTAQALQDQAP